MGAHGRPAVLRALRAVLDDAARSAAAAAPDGLDEAVAGLAGEVRGAGRGGGAALAASASSTPPASWSTRTSAARRSRREAAARVAEIAASYSNLEYDLERGERGDREAHAEARLRELLGAEATVVVNNCAAAVLLAVNTLAEGREVLVSRGELVEIGGSFRIPDVLRKGGARLREVGTTNRTRLADYEAALSPETGLILKVHPSNFRIVGFTEAAARSRSWRRSRARPGIPLVEDLGSGLLEPLAGRARRRADGRRRRCAAGPTS